MAQTEKEVVDQVICIECRALVPSRLSRDDERVAAGHQRSRIARGRMRAELCPGSGKEPYDPGR